LHERGEIPEAWLNRQVRRIDNTQGGIDALSKRLAFIRTWTYVSQRHGWTGDDSHWRERTRAIEDRLSDALHLALMQRFVDRRTSVLLRRLGQKEAMVAEVSDAGDVTVEGEFVGKLDGFWFTQDKGSGGAEDKTIKAAALQALAPHFHLRADRFYNAPDTEIDYTEQGGLMWGSAAVGKLVAGPEPLKPLVEAFVDEVAGADVAEKVRRRLQHFVDRKVASLFEPMLAMQNDDTLTGLARGVAFQLVESFGVLPRAAVAQDVKALDQEARGLLRKHGVRFGQFTIFMPLLLKPAPTRLRLILWSLFKGLDEFPEAPPPGLVTLPVPSDVVAGADTMAGYRIAGARAIRIDMLERLTDLLRTKDSRNGFEANADMLSITGLTLEQFADLLQGLGYVARKGERPKQKATPVADTGDSTDMATAPASDADTPPAPEGQSAAPQEASDPATQAAAQSAEESPDEVEVYYTFSWAGRQGQDPRSGTTARRGHGKRADQGQDARGKGKSGKRPRKDQPGKPKGERKFSAAPPKTDKPIDPDSPFAALAALKQQQ